MKAAQNYSGQPEGGYWNEFHGGLAFIFYSIVAVSYFLVAKGLPTAGHLRHKIRRIHRHQSRPICLLQDFAILLRR